MTLHHSNSILRAFSWVRASICLPLAAALAFALQPAPMVAATPVGTRVITLEVVDANTGNPVSANAVMVECRNGLDSCDTFRVVSDPTETTRGRMRVEIPAQATALVVTAAAGRVDPCSGAADSRTVYGVHSIEASGTVGGNDCHALPARKLQALSPQPGTLVVFVHHRAACRKQLPFCW